MNKNQRKEDVLRQARLLLQDSNFKSCAKYPVQKRHKYIYLHQQYIAFIMIQNDARNVVLADWLRTNYSRYSDRVATEDAALRKIYRASQRVVLNVAEGDC